MILKEYAAALIGLGFIYFIAIRLSKYLNNKKKALITFIIGLVMTIVLVGCTIYDNINITVLPTFSFTEVYYVFLIVSIVYMITIPSIFLAIGCSRHEKFKNYYYKIKKEKEKIKPTINDEKENVYVVIKHNGNFLLKENIVSGNKKYSGIIEKLNKNILFHDEMIKNFIEKYELNKYDAHNIIECKIVGEALVKGKVDLRYYCYVIDISSKNEKLKEFYEVSPYDLVKYEMTDFDKQILFHIVLRDYFKIEL